MKNVEPPGDRSPAPPALNRAWLRRAKQTGNPLLRLPSRRERRMLWLTWAVIVLLAAGVIVSTLLVCRHGMVARQREAQSRHQVTATVLGWSDTKVIGNPYMVASRIDISYPLDHGTRKDTVTTTDAVKPGQTLKIWIDSSGEMVRPPRTWWTVGYDTTLTAILGCVGVALLAAGLRTWYQGWVQRHHLEEWEAEWVAFDSGSQR